MYIRYIKISEKYDNFAKKLSHSILHKCHVDFKIYTLLNYWYFLTKNQKKKDYDMNCVRLLLINRLIKTLCDIIV